MLVPELNFEGDWDALDDRLEDEPSYSYRNLLLSDIEARQERKPISFDSLGGTFDIRHHVLRAKHKGSQADLTQKQWEIILTAFSHCCAYCGVSIGCIGLVVEHAVPICRGGGTTWNNVVPACAPCNSSKGLSSRAAWLHRRFPGKYVEILANIRQVQKGLAEVFAC